MRASVHVFYKVYSDYLLARTLNSRGNRFAKIKFSRIFSDLQYLCSKKKGTDQLCSYYTADLRLCLCIMENPVFS